jgi:hypothetical protein
MRKLTEAEGYDLYLQLQAKTKRLYAAVDELRVAGRDLAAAEKAYKVALCQESLKLRDDGMAVGMIDKVVYGVKTVADLRCKRDIAESAYDATKEAINAIKLDIRVIDGQISREWSAIPND